MLGAARRGGLATQSRRDAKIQRHTAHQKPGLETGKLQNPGQHRGGGCFAVGAGHSQHMAALQQVFGQPLRAAGVGQAGIENGFHERKFRCAIRQMGAAHHVADHKHIGLQGQLVGAKTFDQIDAQRPQLVAHRWVDASVAAGHAVAGLACQRGYAAHEGAANAQNMNVHYAILGLIHHVLCLWPAWNGVFKLLKI